MPNRNKQRGYEHETEVVKALEGYGLDSARARGSDGRALGLTAGVDIAIYGPNGKIIRKLQCKRQKRKISAKYKPGEQVDANVIREDYGGNYVMLRLEDYADMIKHLYYVGRTGRKSSR